MRAMRRRVFEHDVARWATDFLDTLGRTQIGAEGAQPTAESEAS
jgi:trehalose-6-phosphate synthase